MRGNPKTTSFSTYERQIHVFCGTSITLEEAKNRSENQLMIHPPIKRFDIPNILRKENYPGVICIIDGVFFSSESVSLMEIRDAVRNDWTVLGCSSMGALRALEAAPLGMMGYGKVYRWLRMFQVEDDDEVAQAVLPETWAPISLAMVDIRYILRSLAKKGRISTTVSTEIINELKSLFFPKRTLGSLLQALNRKLAKAVSEEEILSFKRPKQQDAEQILNLLHHWSTYGNDFAAS